MTIVTQTLAGRVAADGIHSAVASPLVHPRVFWPPDPVDGRALALLLCERETVFELAEALSVEAGVIVLALQTTALDVATIALEWAGEHAISLGADPAQLIVAGGGLAATAALHARDAGWPPLARQLLFGPERSGWPAANPSLAGVAPATVVDAPQYAGRLRRAGVEVQELPAAPIGCDCLGDSMQAMGVASVAIDLLASLVSA
jgi:hypothetical protein